jgi:Flp pilus assembly protein TadD
MSYEKLDNEELLRIALDAINQDHHADAVAMLKTMLEREPSHVFGTYLLAAEHAQLGLMDRAEEGFERTVQLAPDFPMARFQLGQIYLVKGDAEAAKRVLSPLSQLPANLALSSYARGLVAAANEDIAGAMNELRTGLAFEQEIPALADDMRRVLANLQAIGQSESIGRIEPVPAPAAATPMFLSNYGKSGN